MIMQRAAELEKSIDFLNEILRGTVLLSGVEELLRFMRCLLLYLITHKVFLRYYAGLLNVAIFQLTLHFTNVFVPYPRPILSGKLGGGNCLAVPASMCLVRPRKRYILMILDVDNALLKSCSACLFLKKETQ